MIAGIFPIQALFAALPQYEDPAGGGLESIFHPDTGNTRLGVGVTSPQTTLDIAQSLRVRDLISCERLGTDREGDVSCDSGDGLWSMRNSTNIHYFHRAGIGTSAGSSMSGQLSVEASSGDLLHLNATGSNSPVISFRDDGIEKAKIGYQNTNGFVVSSWNGISTTSRMFINDSGKVGIGVPSSAVSSALLQVNGKMKIANGNGTCTEGGEMRYYAEHFYGCNGASWLQLDGTGEGNEQVNLTALSHSGNNSRNFSITWSGGGDSNTNCKIQVSLDNFASIEKTISSQSCTSGSSTFSWVDHDMGSNWNGSELSVRLIDSGDQVISNERQVTLVCNNIGGSSSSTPNTDEDCDGAWNDSTHGGYYWDFRSHFLAGQTYVTGSSGPCTAGILGSTRYAVWTYYNLQDQSASNSFHTNFYHNSGGRIGHRYVCRQYITYY